MFVSRLGPEEAAIEAARAQIRQLGSIAPQLASGDDRFGAVVESAFTLAKERSAAGDPVIENSGALLALASVLGLQNLVDAYNRPAAPRFLGARFG